MEKLCPERNVKRSRSEWVTRWTAPNLSLCCLHLGILQKIWMAAIVRHRCRHSSLSWRHTSSNTVCQLFGSFRSSQVISERRGRQRVSEIFSCPSPAVPALLKRKSNKFHGPKQENRTAQVPHSKAVVLKHKILSSFRFRPHVICCMSMSFSWRAFVLFIFFFLLLGSIWRGQNINPVAEFYPYPQLACLARRWRFAWREIRVQHMWSSSRP
jgi:hypothetical protein